MDNPYYFAKRRRLFMEVLREGAGRVRDSAHATVGQAEERLQQVHDTLRHAGEHVASTRRRSRNTLELLQSSGKRAEPS
jgi:AcrR family transcriptional regulator